MVTAHREQFFTRETLESHIHELVVKRILGIEALALIDDEMVEMVNRWKWKQGNHTIPGISISSAFFGEHIVGPEEKQRNARKRMAKYCTTDELSTIPAIQDEASFPELYQIEQGLNEAQYMLLEQLISRELIAESHRGLGINSSEVDLFFVITTIPIQEDWAEKIALAAGISVDKIFIYHKACNSSGSAIYDLHNGVFDEEIAARNPNFKKGGTANITLYADETANRLEGKADTLSAQFFSSAASAMSFRYSMKDGVGPLTLLHGDQVDIQKGADALKYSKPYDQWPNYRARYKNRIRETKYLSAPEKGFIIDMDGIESGKYFRTNAFDLIQRVFTEYIEQEISKGNLKRFERHDGKSQQMILDLSQYTDIIKKLVVHHPGGTIFNSLGKQLKNKNWLGFKDHQLQFVITEGNAPSVTIPIALGRQLEDSPEYGEGIKDGDKIILLSFGAGGSFTCGIYQYHAHEQAETQPELLEADAELVAA